MSTNVNVPRGEQQHSTGQAWYVAALVISLGVHGWGYFWSRSFPIQGLKEAAAPALLPPRFVVKQVQFDPKSLQDAPEPAPAAKKEPPSPDKLVFSDAKPQAADVKLDVKPVDLSKQLVDEKPKAQTESLAMTQLPQSTAGALDSELSALAGAFLKAPAVSNAQPVLAMSQQLAKGASKMGAGTGVGDSAVPGRQSIEEALANIGQVPTRESPVAIPGNALFGHDSSDLGPESIPMLEKIADLRRRFPDYIMGIIGHTDSTGSPEYNMRLSQRRADAVKEWLVRRYNMNPAKLETMGRGSQELLVPTGNVEEQAPNRRVEVLLRPSGPAQGARPVKKAN
jgi:outer membrane protein OmpA-like peptidoglycan-associated protein